MSEQYLARLKAAAERDRLEQLKLAQGIGGAAYMQAFQSASPLVGSTMAAVGGTAARPGSVIGKIFDVAQAGMYGGVGAVREAERVVRDRKDDTALGAAGRIVGAFAKGHAAPFRKDQAAAAADKPVGLDALAESDWGNRLIEDSPLLAILLGLGTEVVTDWTTWLGVGATKLGTAGRLASSAQEAAGTGAMLGRSAKMAAKAGRVVEKGAAASGKTAAELAAIYDAGPAAQAAAGMRGVTFAGKRLPINVAPAYRFGEQLPKYLSRTPDPAVIASSKVYSALERNVPGLRRAASRVAEAFTPGDVMQPAVRAANIQAHRGGQVAEAWLGEPLPELFKKMRPEMMKADDPAEWLASMSQVLERTPEKTAEFFDMAAKRLEAIDAELARGGVGKKASTAWMHQPEGHALAAEGLPLWEGTPTKGSEIGRGAAALQEEADFLKRKVLVVRQATDIAEKHAVPTEFIEDYTKFSNVVTEAQRAADEAVGLPFYELASDELAYNQHMTNRAWIDEAGRMAGGELAIRRVGSINAKNPAQRYRLLREYTPLEASLISTGKVPGMDAGDIFGQEFKGVIFKNEPFVTNPALVAQARIRNAGKVITRDGYIEGAKRMLVPANPELVAQGWRTPLAQTEQWGDVVKHFEGMVGEPSLVANIEHVWQMTNNPSELKDLYRLWDTGMNYWRGYALLSPGYTTRNLASNIYQTWLAGLKDPTRYHEAVQFQKGMRRFPKDGGEYLSKFFIDTPNGRMSGTELRKMLLSEDLLGGLSNEWARESHVMEAALDMSRGPLRVAKQANRGVLNTSRVINGGIENMSKFALMFDRLVKGDTPFAAANMVREFLFDYTPTGLSRFESGPLRRVTSFWRWTKNNMILSGKNIVAQPGKFAAIPKVMRAVNELSAEGAPAEDYLPHFLADSVRLPKWAGGNYFSLKNWLPAMEIAELFEGMGEGQVNIPGFYWLMGIAAPFISEPFEQALNRDDFTQRDIHPMRSGVPLKGVTEPLLGAKVPPRAAHAIKTFVPPAGRLNVFADKKGTLGSDLQSFLSSRTYPYDRAAEMERAGWRRDDIVSGYRQLRNKALESSPPDYAAAKKFQLLMDSVPLNP